MAYSWRRQSHDLVDKIVAFMFGSIAGMHRSRRAQSKTPHVHGVPIVGTPRTGQDADRIHVG
jgi:hypothetical protein